MSAIAGFSELVLVVEDVPRSARFYREVVGLQVERPADEGWAWFWVGDPGASQRLALRRGPLLFEEQSPRPAEDRWGSVHFGLRVPRGRLAATIERVEQSGYSALGPVRFDWMRAVSYFIYDPDGNLVEYWSPDPTDGADGN